MSTARRIVTASAMFVVAAGICAAQSIAPAHSGTVHYFEGDVTVDGAKLVSQVARFTEMKEQSVLQTGLGRAEILLTPGVLLRVGENSSVKMLDNRLISTRVEFISGIAMVEALDAGNDVKDPPVTIIYKDLQAQPVHYGVFELTSEPGELRVFKGEARIVANGSTVNVKDGNLVNLTTASLATAKFDAKQGDDLYLWSRDRSAYLSAGNMSSARTLGASGYGNSFGTMNGPMNGLGYGNGYGMGYGSGYAYTGWNPAMWSGFSGGWYYNSYLNMYSYLPFSGTIYSPFGYGFYNPVTIGYAYTPGYYWAGSGGSRTGTTTGVPLATLPPVGSTKTSGAPQLPRLGLTASFRPTLASPARGTEPGAPTSSLASRGAFAAANAANNGMFGSNARGAINPGAATATNAPLTTMSAPVSVAPAAAAAAPARAAVGRR
jgi:hypothetical protein